MGPHDASMAALYVRNRRRATKYGEIPLSAGEIEYLSGKDEAARRRQRLLEMRNHEKRVAQLVTQRYRDNLRRLHAHKLRGAQLAHQQQQERLLGDLHIKYQQSLQNVGSAHRQAREMLAELVEDAHVEQSKWAFNEACVTKARSGEASRLHDEEKETGIARRKDVEDNLQRLKETSMRQRAQASIRARRKQESQIELARRQEEAVRFCRQVVKEEVFAMPRSHARDVDAYQFTRLHCVSAPAVPATAVKPRPEVKVIRHNRAHPSAVNSIDQAKTYSNEMDAKREQDRSLREQNVEKAGQRGDDALEQVKSKQDGERAIEWLQQIDEAQRHYEQTADYAYDFQSRRAGAGGDRNEDGASPPQANERAAEETFRRMFAIVREDQMELSMHSARTLEDAPVDRVAVSPLRQWSHQRRESIDPAASEFDDDDDSERESFASSQSGSRAGSVGFETITASFGRLRQAHKSGQGGKMLDHAGTAATGKKVSDEASQPTRDPAFSEGWEDRLAKERFYHRVDNLEQRNQQRQPVDERRDSGQEHDGRDSAVLSSQLQSKQQEETYKDRRASLRSSSSSESEARSEYEQRRQHDEAQGGHAGVRSSRADLPSHERHSHQLQTGDQLGDEHASFQYSVTKESIAKRTSVQPAERDEEGDVDERSSLHSFASRHGRATGGDYQLQQRGNGQEEDRESVPNMQTRTSLRFSAQSDGDEDELHWHSRASSGSGGDNFLDGHLAEANGKIPHLQQRDPATVKEDAGLHSPASSRSSQEAYAPQGDRVNHYAATSVDAGADGDIWQLLQHDEAESEYTSARSSRSSSLSGTRTDFQLQQQKDTQDEHVGLRASSSSSHQSDASVGYHFQQRDEAYDEQTNLRSPALSHRSSRRIVDQLLERLDIQEDRASLRSSSAVSSASRLDGNSLFELRQREDTEVERASLHSSVSSESRSSGSVLQLRPQHENGDDDYVGDFAGQDSVESSVRRSKFTLPRPGPLMAEHANQHSPASSHSSQQAHVASQDKGQLAEPATHFSESFVRRQLLSESEESFDGSVSVGSAGGGFAGDRRRLYIQKIHERLQNFAGRSSAASSVAQYSLPLSDSMSSMNESFHDHLAASGYGDDSFIHKLVPMFPVPGALAIEQVNDGDDEIHEQYDVQLVDPALSRMLGDSVHSRISSMAPRVPLSVDIRDVHDETEAQTHRFEQWSISDQVVGAGVAMEQHSLLSDSVGSGVSSVGFSALLHFTAGMTRNARDDNAEREALESEEKAESGRHEGSQRRSFPSESSLSVDTRFNYLASMTATVGESLSLHLRLPAMIYGNTDMSAPPRPIKWPSSSSSSSSVTETQEEASARDQLDRQPQKAASSSDSDDEDHASEREQEQESSSHQSSGHGDDSDDEMRYEAFRRGLMEGKMGSLPPPPFGNMDMSRPPPPLVRPHQRSGSQSRSSSSRSSSHSSAAAASERVNSSHEKSLDEEDKRENDERDSRNDSSVFSEASSASAATSRGERRTRGRESLPISVGSDENEEQKEDHWRAVSLADAFRQRHPRFRERVDENREQQKQKRHELHNLQQQQQQDKENSRAPNTAAKSTSFSQNPGTEAAQVAAKNDSGADLTEEQQQLLGRLAVGDRAQVSAQEMKERTKRNYQKLPEVVERKRQEEILRRRKQRLAELREQEKARRLQQKQRREQQKRRDEAHN